LEFPESRNERRYKGVQHEIQERSRRGQKKKGLASELENVTLNELSGGKTTNEGAQKGKEVGRI